MVTGKGKTTITSDAVVPRNRGQSLKVVEKKHRSIERKGRHLSDFEATKSFKMNILTGTTSQSELRSSQQSVTTSRPFAN